MIVQCAGIFGKNPNTLSIGICIDVDNRKNITRHKFLTAKNWDVKTGRTAARYEAVIMGLEVAREIYSKWLAQPPLNRMSFVDLGDGSPDPLDLRELKEIKLVMEGKIAGILNSDNIVTTPFLKNYYVRYQGLKEYFQKKGFQVILARGAVIEAKKIAQNAEPENKIAKYKKHVKTLMDSGEFVVPLSIFKKKDYKNLTISEAIIIELIEIIGLTVAQTADTLGREYNTVQTQYYRAKKKVQL